MTPPSVYRARDPPSKVSSRTAPRWALKVIGLTTREVKAADSPCARVRISLPRASPGALQNAGSWQRNAASQVE